MVIREKARDVREMISINDVLKRIPVSRSTIERKVREGTFSKMYSIAPMRVGLFLDEVVEWQKRLAETAIRQSESENVKNVKRTLVPR
jgi:predicted DNA-binding transcriptional regulator AlpA